MNQKLSPTQTKDLGSFSLVAHEEPSFTATHITTEWGDHHDDVKPRSLLIRWLEMLFPLVVGASISFAGALNHELSEATNSPFLITLFSYGIAGVISTAWSFATGRQPPMREAARNVKQFMDQHWYNWFILTAGFIGAFLHLCVTVITGTLGASLLTVGSAFGTILGSIVLDYTGFAWNKRHRVSKFTLAGCVVVLAGTAIHKHEVFQPEQEDHLSLGVKTLLIFITVIQGVASVIKSAIGGEFSVICGRSRRSTAFSFITGTALMALVVACYHPGLTVAPLRDFSLSWRLFAALLTIFNVAVLFIYQRRLGGAVTYCCLTVGQILASTVLDVAGWFSIKQRPFETWHAVGISVFLVGIAFSTYGKMRVSSITVSKAQEP
eukprot:Protomagalhaensia_sp_Gyna_25__5060@NODE_56_length_5952_cov_234_277524_g41_i0_p4_GENE_NODE_56_length_5952_cov_234_277524_g41_i0NODE_56_length_5952_cov_234_277524_g41_i0_p4_ORF_typecomplete_len380_score33_94DMT_YdcZ/PF04657_13/1_4e20DMT_YdcZ/PF04657_13/4_5e18DUF2306/PF10067_9/9_9e02DUF2306/PF10067_9/1_3DUF2306/PF10067_9/0_89DUF4560/PF15118_6/14DUF4560/PF15118_6/477TMRDISM_7TM/PF07695_11/0_167TMRDISM_7TM/PF07695_11/55Herpes_UL73/PF03554_13/6_6e02Herpes_UL73/PF03554_13/1_9_NODE_56_length_5952_cov_23